MPLRSLMGIMFLDGSLLFSDGDLAMHEDCCCIIETCDEFEECFNWNGSIFDIPVSISFNGLNDCGVAPRTCDISGESVYTHAITSSTLCPGGCGLSTSGSGEGTTFTSCTWGGGLNTTNVYRGSMSIGFDPIAECAAIQARIFTDNGPSDFSVTYLMSTSNGYSYADVVAAISSLCGGGSVEVSYSSDDGFDNSVCDVVTTSTATITIG